MTATATGTYRCIVPGCGKPAAGLQCNECREAKRSPEQREQVPSTRTTGTSAERDVLEADVSAVCDGYLELHGWTVYRIGISEAGRVYQTPGIPDRLAVHMATQRWAWIEYKRPVGGEQSEAQVEYARLCRIMGWTYLIVTRLADVEALHREAA